MKKPARMLGVLACAGALCLGGCISPDLEPPHSGGKGNLPSVTGNNAPRSAAEAAGGTAATAQSTADGDTLAMEPTTPAAGTAQSMGAGGSSATPTTAPGASVPAGTAGAGANSMTAPPATTPGGSAGAGAGQQPSDEDTDAGVETP